MKFRLKAHGQFKPLRWEENTIEAFSSQQKITSARAEFSFLGEFEGKGTVEYLMFYQYFDEANKASAEASFVGLMRFQGRVDGRAGTCVWHEAGTYEKGLAQSDIKIIEGSGTGELEGILGRGTIKSTSSTAEIDLDYTLDLDFSQRAVGT